MSNIQKVMNDEIRRLARKEIKVALAAVLTANANLRKKVADQEKRIKALEAQKPVCAETTEKAAPAEVKEKAVRLTPERIKKIRKGLSISQAQLAQLLGVNTQSVNFWENGKTKPRMAVKRRLAEIRDMGKRELEALFASKAITAKKAKKAVSKKEAVVKKDAKAK